MNVFDELRADLHVGLDAAFDAWLRKHRPASQEWEIAVVPRDPLDTELRHKWPDGTTEVFSRGRYFSGEVAGVSAVVLVAHADVPRETWGQPRRRAVTFSVPRQLATDRYPLSEWVETDDGQMATGVPDPARPRALLKDGDMAPAWLDDWTVRRADEIFATVTNGPSLRVVVDSGDDARMAAFGLRIGLIRGRIGAVPRRAFEDWPVPPAPTTDPCNTPSSAAPEMQLSQTARRPWKDWPVADVEKSRDTSMATEHHSEVRR